MAVPYKNSPLHRGPGSNNCTFPLVPEKVYKVVKVWAIARSDQMRRASQNPSAEPKHPHTVNYTPYGVSAKTIPPDPS